MLADIFNELPEGIIFQDDFDTFDELRKGLQKERIDSKDLKNATIEANISKELCPTNNVSDDSFYEAIKNSNASFLSLLSQEGNLGCTILFSPPLFGSNNKREFFTFLAKDFQALIYLTHYINGSIKELEGVQIKEKVLNKDIELLEVDIKQLEILSQTISKVCLTLFIKNVI